MQCHIAKNTLLHAAFSAILTAERSAYLTVVVGFVLRGIPYTIHVSTDRRT